MYATLYIVKDLKKIPQLFPWRRVRGISRHILEKKKKKFHITWAIILALPHSLQQIMSDFQIFYTIRN